MNVVEKERLCRSELDEFLALIGLDSSSFPADVEAALRFLHDHLFEETLNASRVQEQDGLRSHNLPTRFKRYLGLGLREYIEDRRIMAAMRLLWHREFEVYFVAASVGYAHHETFTRAFKRRVGCTPTQFRELFPPSVTAAPDAPPSSPDAPPPLQFSEAAMFITDVIGIQTGSGDPDLRVEGSAADQATVLVTVTGDGETFSEVADVGPDGAWVARFSDGSARFRCGEVLQIEARKPGDEQEQARWEGPLECADLVPPRRAEAVGAESVSAVQEAGGRDGGGDTDDTVMTVTVASGGEGPPSVHAYGDTATTLADEPVRCGEPSRRNRTPERPPQPRTTARSASADDVHNLRGEIDDLRAQLRNMRNAEHASDDDRQNPSARSSERDRGEGDQRDVHSSVLRELRQEIRALRTERSDRDRQTRDRDDDTRDERDERSLAGEAAVAMQEQIDALKREVRSQRGDSSDKERDENDTRARADDQTEAKDSYAQESDTRDSDAGDSDAEDSASLRDAVQSLQRQIEALHEQSLGSHSSDAAADAADDTTDDTTESARPHAEHEDDLAGRNREDLYDAVQLLRQRVVDLEQHDGTLKPRDDRRDDRRGEERSRTERVRDKVREVRDHAEQLADDHRDEVPRRRRSPDEHDDRRPPARRDRDHNEVPVIRFEPVEVGEWTAEGRCEIHVRARVSHPSREPVAAELVDDRSGEVLADGRSERGRLTLSERIEVEPGRHTFMVHVTEPSPSRLALVWEIDGERAQAAQRAAHSADGDGEDDEDAGWVSRAIGAGWALVTAAFLLLVASGAHGVLRGIATAVFLGSFGTYLALTIPRRWAIWTFVGLGAFALALIGLLPFTPIVQMDSYLIVAGLAALGLAAAAGIALFKGED